MADLWVKAVEGGREYRWRRTTSGAYACDAEWSTRGTQRPAKERAPLNRLIAAAGGTT